MSGKAPAILAALEGVLRMALKPETEADRALVDDVIVLLGTFTRLGALFGAKDRGDSARGREHDDFTLSKAESAVFERVLSLPAEYLTVAIAVMRRDGQSAVVALLDALMPASFELGPVIRTIVRLGGQRSATGAHVGEQDLVAFAQALGAPSPAAHSGR